MSIKVKKFKSNAGSKIMIKYIRVVDDNFIPTIVANEKFNLYEDIQTYKDDNNIEKIIARLGGDISKIDFNKGLYIDCTNIPDNYNDLYKQTQLVADDYSKLPIKYKKALNNNYHLFYGLAMSGKVKDFINSYDSYEKGLIDFSKVSDFIKSDNFNFNGVKKDDSVLVNNSNLSNNNNDNS